MRRRRLGRTGLEVSEIALGTVELGLDYGLGGKRPEEREAAALLHYALDTGVNLIDTARAYGTAEGIIGRALGGRRSEYLLASKAKVGTAEEVRRQVEESLRELRAETIDILLLHCGAEPVEPDEESTGALVRLREEGKVRFIGSSVYGAEAALAAIDSGWFDCLEIAYNVLDRRPEQAVLQRAARHDIGILARSVLLRGALTDRFPMLPTALAGVKDCAARLAAMAGGVERLPEFAYRYVLASEPPHAALVGTSSAEELRACIGYASLGPLPDDAIAAASAVVVGDERWLNPGSWPAES